MASDKLLRELFDSLIQDLSNRIKNGTATAADLGVARQLLKDNGIDCSPSKGSPVSKLYEILPFDPAQDDQVAN
jgi:hypothetical protein